MTILNTKQRLTVLWLALGLTLGSGIIGTQIGFDIVPATYACGSGAGGGC
jgi:hypothetical protein